MRLNDLSITGTGKEEEEKKSGIFIGVNVIVALSADDGSERTSYVCKRIYVEETRCWYELHC